MIRAIRGRMGVLDERAARLREARAAAGFSGPADAASRFRWPYPTYAAHENGGRSYVRSAARYAKAFRVSEAWLLTGEGRGPGGRVHAASVDLVEQIVAEINALPTTELQEQALELVRAVRRAVDQSTQAGTREPPEEE
jgi:hypothetical protein